MRICRSPITIFRKIGIARYRWRLCGRARAFSMLFPSRDIANPGISHAACVSPKLYTAWWTKSVGMSVGRSRPGAVSLAARRISPPRVCGWTSWSMLSEWRIAWSKAWTGPPAGRRCVPGRGRAMPNRFIARYWRDRGMSCPGSSDDRLQVSSVDAGDCPQLRQDGRTPREGREMADAVDRPPLALLIDRYQRLDILVPASLVHRSLPVQSLG